MVWHCGRGHRGTEGFAELNELLLLLEEGQVRWTEEGEEEEGQEGEKEEE